MKQDDIIETTGAIEEAAQYHADLYSRGKELYQRYSEVDPNDQNILDEFFVNEFGSDGYSASFDQEAFKHYANVRQNRREDNQADVPKVTRGVESLPLNVAINKFIADNQASAKAWGRSQLDKYKRDLAFFRDQMDNCDVAVLTSDKIKKQYVHRLHLLPAHIQQNKLFYDKSGELLPIDKIIQLTKKTWFKNAERSYISRKSR